ncbi:phage holin family protein [Candidatus Kuenenbacteria bacterium]|nr:phage holin family protein [Candidatus Kuenenbacteria bacterium]
MIRWLYHAAIICFACWTLPGVHVASFWTAMVTSMVMIIASVFIKPILRIIAMPITFVTLGLFSLVINGIIVLVVDSAVDGFSVDNIWWGIAFAFIVSAVFSIVSGGSDDDDDK